MSNNTYKAIGLMSGSSLDGVDIAYCQFDYDTKKKKWSYKILAADNVSYDNKWKLRLGKLGGQNAITFVKTHTFYGHYLGKLVRDFVAQNNIEGEVDFIASHGHTIFHDPRNRITSQIGDGAAIAVVSGIPAITNFRNNDLAAGGEGAPLVPMGDKHLFSDHLFCLNLGGIANISCKLADGNMIGYDITAANQILNSLAQELDADYDSEGRLAASGSVDHKMLGELNNMGYYKKPYPKSLNNGWVYWVLRNIVNRHNSSVEDKLRTFVEHIAVQVAREIDQLYKNEKILKSAGKSMLVTGGGAHNSFLIKCISALSPVKVKIPDEQTIEFKEAIIMAFIGALRMRKETNFMSSVTGADEDVIGGGIYWA